MQDRIPLGDTLNFVTTVTGYPASEGWTLYYRLVPASGTPILLTATVDPDNADGYIVQVAAATTANWAAGNYTAAAYVTLGTERYSVASESGQVVVHPNPASIGPGTDTRTQAEIALADARAAFAAWSPTQKGYMIGGRQMYFNTPGQIIEVINHWAAEVQRDQRAADIAAGLGSAKGKVYVRMARA